MKKKKLFTLFSTVFFALPIIPVIAFLTLIWLASIPPDAGAIVTITGLAAALSIFSFPFVAILSSLSVIGFQIVAIVRKEILWLNILLIVLSLAVCFLELCFFQQIWLRMMSV